jgi:tetratricopeptide (TPR) repeat protein
MRALLLLLLASPQEDWPQARPTRVEVAGSGLEQRATLVATNANLETLMRSLAERSGRVLEGPRPPDLAPALVTVELFDRPLTQVLEYVLGSVGLDYELSPTSLRLLRPAAETPPTDELLARAMATYLRSASLFPEAREQERARLDQGRVELLRGNPEAALYHFTSLIDTHPRSPLVPDAQLASADLLARLERFEEAHSLYLRVTELPAEDPRRGRARLGLARCQMELSNPSFTILMLRRLERDSPSEDPLEKGQRLLLLARALESSELPVEALEALDELERLGAPLELQVEAMEIRALALERLEYVPAAGRAWMVVARQTRGQTAARAYRRAAEIALAHDEPLSVLFVERELAQRGAELAGADIRELVFDARLALGLSVDWRSADPERQLAAARRASELDEAAAQPIWEALLARGESLAPKLRLEAAMSLARLLSSSAGLDAALAVLAGVRSLDPQAADQMAGELCQRAREFNRAAQAFLGRY